MAEKKKKWDDKEEGKKPWEHGYVPPKKPSTPKKKKKKPAAVSPKGPGSAAEDIIGELDRRNKGLVDRYGEPVSHSKKKKR